MFSQMGLAIGIATFFAVTSTTFLLMGALLISHQLTAYWDLHYAGGKRTITPLEQQIHSLLEMMPLFAFVLIGLANWDALLKLLGIGAGTRTWSLTLISPALPAWYLAGLAGCVVVFSVLPYWYELFACIRYSKRRAQHIETPDLHRTRSR